MGRPKGALDKKPLASRFWEKVSKTRTCWLWQGALNNKGYGKFWDTQQIVLAHRFSWVLAGHMIADGTLVLHSCDTPACVRPTHLRAGTQTDNMRDALRRVRGHGRARLGPPDVVRIRTRLANGEHPKVIAKDYNVTFDSVYQIKYRRTWSWL